MRKYKRAVARARMRKLGVQKMNKPRKAGKSYFAENWRKFL